MDVREKLVELLAPTSLDFEQAVEVADYLAKNGVTVQEWVKVEERLPKTNADRIRAMSDDELASAIAEAATTGACNDFGIPGSKKCCGDCSKCDAIINWLQQPAEQK